MGGKNKKNKKVSYYDSLVEAYQDLLSEAENLKIKEKKLHQEIILAIDKEKMAKIIKKISKIKAV